MFAYIVNQADEWVFINNDEILQYVYTPLYPDFLHMNSVTSFDNT